MFDFRTTLREAEEAVKNNHIGIATFYYWQINFAYNDEEFPDGCTTEMLCYAEEKFRYYAFNHTYEIFSDKSYILYRAYSYKNKYLENFERVMNSIIRKKNSSDMSEFALF